MYMERIGDFVGRAKDGNMIRLVHAVVLLFVWAVVKVQGKTTLSSSAAAAAALYKAQSE